jgi:hypothetical protein
MKYLILLTGLLVSISCGSPSSTEERIFVDIYSSADLSEFFESYHYVILETNDNALIRNVDRVHVEGDRIYTFDKRSKAVFVFDNKGRYINKIQKIGRGPGEYIYANDFQIVDGDIHILTGRAIQIYAEEGQFLKKIELDDSYNNFYIQDDGRIFLASERVNSSFYNFRLYDPVTESYVSSLDPFPEQNGMGSEVISPFNPTGEGAFLITKRYDPVVYRLDEDSFSSAYRFEFNTPDKVPTNFAEISAVELYDEYSFKSVVQRIQRIHEQGNRLFMWFTVFHKEYAIRNHLALVDTDSHAVIRHMALGFWGVGVSELDETFPFAMYSPVSLVDGYMITAIFPTTLLALEQAYSLGVFDETMIQETDNPVLFFHKMKME